VPVLGAAYGIIGPVSDGYGQIIVRRRRVFRFFLRGFKIQIDGVVVGSVRNGGVSSFHVPAGGHEVRATLDWQGSPPVAVQVPAGGAVSLEVAPTTDPLAVAHVADRSYKLLSLTPDQ
jgi:hypothetical protein